MKRIRNCIREIGNWRFLRKTIRDNRDKDEWIKHGLYVGWGVTTYIVVNLPPEVIESDEQLWRVYVLDKVAMMDDYFIELGINEIVRPEVDDLVNKEKGVYAYGVRFVPVFRYLTWPYILTWVGAFAAAWIGGRSIGWW